MIATISILEILRPSTPLKTVFVVLDTAGGDYAGYCYWRHNDDTLFVVPPGEDQGATAIPFSQIKEIAVSDECDSGR